MEIPLGSTHAQSGAPTSNFKLSKAGVVPPTLKAPTSLIPGSGKGQPSTSYKDWFDFVYMAHSRHLELKRAQVEYTLISMPHRAIQSNLPFAFPTDEETDKELYSSDEAQQIAKGDFPDPTIVSDGPLWCSQERKLPSLPQTKNIHMM